METVFLPLDYPGELIYGQGDNGWLRGKTQQRKGQSVLRGKSSSVRARRRALRWDKPLPGPTLCPVVELGLTPQEQAVRAGVL